MLGRPQPRGYTYPNGGGSAGTGKSLVGRERGLAICARADDGPARNIAGPGGVRKTRLAVKLAAVHPHPRASG